MNNNTTGIDLNYLLFKLDDNKEFGVDVTELRNIVKTSTINSIPSQNSLMVGVIQDRGRTIPVIDTSLCLGYSPTDISHDSEKLVIVTELTGEPVGFLIKEANEIIRVQPSAISKDYTSEKSSNLLKYIVNTDNGMLAVINPLDLIKRVV